VSAAPTTAGLTFPTIGLGGAPDPASAPSSSYQYIDARRKNLIASAHQRPLLRLWDENHLYIGNIAQEIKVDCEELMSDSGGGNVTIRKDNWLSDFILYDRRAEQDLHLTIDPIPTQRSWRTRWGGKITNVSAKRDSGGLHTIDLQAVHNREHLKHIVAQANPVFPPELQYPKMWIVPWNIRTALQTSLFINLARQFEPFLAIPDNIFNPTFWLGQNPLNINPLNWAIQPQFINPVFDTSRFEVFASRWQDFHSASSVILEDAGSIYRAYTWIKGEDTESPHPELAGIGTLIPGALGDFVGEITNDIFMPTRTCIVLACEDKSGVVGWTGTFADGPISALASTADDLVTDVLIPQYAPNGSEYTLENNGEGALLSVDPIQIANWFSASPKPPWVVFRDGEYSGIIESTVSVHGTTAKTIHIGGKSPGYVNDTISFGIKWGLAQLSDVIEFVYPSGPVSGGEGAFQPPLNGLDELYQGELDDTALAFQSFSDPTREVTTGSMGYLEDMQAGAGTSYTIAGVLALRAGIWKTRAYDSFKTTVRNAAPYIYNVDFTLGDRVGFQMANVVYVDQVSAVKYSWDANSPVNWEISIGTNANEQDPVSKAMRGIAGIWNMFGAFAGATGTM